MIVRRHVFRIKIWMALATVLSFSTSDAKTGGGVSPSVIEKLESNMCASEADVKMEASAGCVQCDIDQATAPSKLKDVGDQATVFAKVANHAKSDQERVQRDLAFFRLLDDIRGTGGGAEYIAYQKEIDRTQKYIKSYQKEELKYNQALMDSQRENDLWTSLAKGSPLPSSKDKEFLRAVLQLKLKSPSGAGDELDSKSMSTVLSWLKAGAQNNRPNPEAFAQLAKVAQKSKATQQIRLDETLASQKQMNDELKELETRFQKLKQAPAAPAKKSAKSDLDQLRAYEAKYQSLIAELDFTTCGMSIAEIVALEDYTHEGYEGLNSSLRKGGELAQRHQAYIDVLVSAMKKLNPYKGTAKRGGILPPEVLATHQPGAIVSYPAFTSTSVGDGFSSSHRFIIKSKTGRYIAPYSATYDEYEVLFAPNTKFKILSRKEKPDGQIDFIMEEVGP